MMVIETVSLASNRNTIYVVNKPHVNVGNGRETGYFGDNRQIEMKSHR